MPLLDRIDIHIEVPAARYQDLTSNIPAESSAQIKTRVEKAREIQKEGSENIKTGHLSEAIQYRSLDRDFFDQAQ